MEINDSAGGSGKGVVQLDGNGNVIHAGFDDDEGVCEKSVRLETEQIAEESRNVVVYMGVQ